MATKDGVAVGTAVAATEMPLLGAGELSVECLLGWELGTAIFGAATDKEPRDGKRANAKAGRSIRWA